MNDTVGSVPHGELLDLNGFAPIAAIPDCPLNSLPALSKDWGGDANMPPLIISLTLLHLHCALTN